MIWFFIGLVDIVVCNNDNEKNAFLIRENYLLSNKYVFLQKKVKKLFRILKT